VGQEDTKPRRKQFEILSWIRFREDVEPICVGFKLGTELPPMSSPLVDTSSALCFDKVPTETDQLHVFSSSLRVFVFAFST
jgi:hypothetical protein